MVKSLITVDPMYVCVFNERTRVNVIRACADSSSLVAAVYM